MNKTEIAPGIMVYDNVLPNYEFLVKDIEDSVDAKAVSWHQASVQAYEEPGVDTNSRDTSAIGVPYTKHFNLNYEDPTSSFYFELARIFYSSFDPLERDYMNSYGVNFSNHYPWDILKYGVGQKFTNHIDDHQDYPRRISTVYYMNDNYSGGEINFPRFNLSYKPKANQMLVFPSNYVYNHSVSPVTDGTRYAVVSWIN
jgi:hypothetical protein